MVEGAEPRLDWGAILRAVAVVIIGSALVGFIVPPALTVAFQYGHTGVVAGSDWFRWGFWAVAWALTIWQGAWMRRAVGDRIWDDMVVVAVIVGALLLAMKVVIALVYEPLNEAGELMPIITALDTFAALILLIVAIIGAGANRF